MSRTTPLEQLDDAVPTQPPPMSCALRAQLEALGLWEMQGWLCGPLGLRSMAAFAKLWNPEFDMLCGFSIDSLLLNNDICTKH